MSVYKFVELVGTSQKSWEDAALKVVSTAEKSLEELRIAEVIRQDLVIGKGRAIYRVRMKVSFKYLGGAEDADIEWGIS